MNFDAPTVRHVLGAIRKDPLSTEQWHNLLIHCFDQKDSDSFESYQIISDCLDNLVRAEKLRSLGRGGDGKILLDNDQKQTLIQLSMDPSNPAALEALGRFLLTEFGQRAEARRIFARASEIDPVNVELHQWLERCGDGAATSPAALDIDTGEMPLDQIRQQAKNADIRRMLRVTSRVSPNLVSHKAPVAGSPAANLPSPVPVTSGIPAGDGSEKEFLEYFDEMLVRVMRGQADGVSAGMRALEKAAPGPSALAGAYSLAAHILHAQGRREAALELYQKAIAIAPMLSSLYYFQAMVYHELGRREDAKAAYQGVIARFPGHEQAWMNLGVLHYEMEQYDNAEVCLRKAISLQPGSAKLWDQLASVLIERGDMDGALQAANQLALLDPGNPEALLKRGVIHLQMNDLGAAEAALANALELDPGLVPALCYIAVTLARAGRADEAMDHCGRVGGQPGIGPLVSAAWLETGLAYEQADDQARALQCFKASVETDASQARAWTRIGLICRRNGSLEESEIALVQAVKADPSETRAWSELGVTRYKVGRYAEAAEAFMKASALAPAVSDWPYNAGVALEKAGRADDAARAYEKAVKLQTDHASARINLGLIYVQQGHPLKAASCLQGLVLVRPDYARAWFGLGLVYEGMRKWEESLRALEKAVKLEPSLIEAHSHLAYVYDKLGRTEEARASAALAQADNIPPTAAEAV